jgi:hypothetical protein
MDFENQGKYSITIIYVFMMLGIKYSWKNSKQKGNTYISNKK